LQKARKKNAAKIMAAILLSSIVFVLVLGFLYYYSIQDNTAKNEEKIAFTLRQIIKGEFGNQHRRFIQVSDDGYYVIQDFHHDGRPQTNPYRVKYKEDLYRDHSEQISIDGFYFEDKSDSSSGLEYVNYLNGLKEGLRLKIYKDGSIELIENYHHGLLDGKYTRFFRNGNTDIEGVAMQSQNKFKATSWWYTGKKMQEMVVVGKTLTEDTAWHENGSLRRKGFNNNGKGHWTTWYENGQVSSELFMENSIPVKCSEYSKDGTALHKDETDRNVCEEIHNKKYYREIIESDWLDGPPARFDSDDPG
jgi:antitoxin component YwqK of YwqJK toxin-antitoxin module